MLKLINTCKTILYTIQLLIKNGIPSYILYFGDSLGDNLLLTIQAKALRDRGYNKVWIKCNYPELFKSNPDVGLVLPYNTLLSMPILKALGIQLVRPFYTVYDPQTDRDAVPEKHIVLKMADCLQIKGAITNKPILILDNEEKKRGIYANRQLVIATSSSNAMVPMRNKEWITSRYQQIVDHFKNEYTIIQLGAPNDELLNGVTDLRGKTLLRESAAILSNSQLLVAHVGFLMHLARAVDCPSVIIYGGREKPEQSGYTAFKNIYTDLECSPCWLHNACHYDRKCMKSISANQVCEIIESQLNNGNGKLAVDVLVND